MGVATRLRMRHGLLSDRNSLERVSHFEQSGIEI